MERFDKLARSISDVANTKLSLKVTSGRTLPIDTVMNKVAGPGELDV